MSDKCLAELIDTPKIDLHWNLQTGNLTITPSSCKEVQHEINEK